EYDSAIDRFGEESRNYASQEMGGAAMAAPSHDNGHDSGPSFFQKFTHTSAFERVRSEAGSIGDAAVQELTKVAKTVVLPALITSLRNFIGDHLPNADPKKSSYQPSLERNPS